MTGSIRIEIAGIRAEFHCRGDALDELGVRYAHFTFTGHSNYVCRFSSAGKRGVPVSPVVEGHADSTRFRRWDFDCLIDRRAKLGRLRIYPGIQSFDSFLRTFYSWLLLREGGMILHSAGIVKAGRAYLFLGKSGAGKSTLAKLAADRAGNAISGVLTPPRLHASRLPVCSVISDELNLVRYEKGRFMAYGSPFWGEMRNEGRQGRWPLAGVFILKKSVINMVSDLPRGAAMGVLLRCLMNFSREPETARLALAASVRLMSTIPFRRLEFSKENADSLKLI